MSHENILEKLNKNKNNKFFILQGEIGNGKTEGILAKAVHLQNNFSMDKDENILVITSDNKNYNKSYMNKLQEHISPITLFSFIGGNIEMYNIDELLDELFYKSNKKLETIGNDELLKVISKGVEVLKENNSCVEKYDIKFLLEEIQYIKYINIKSLEEYMELKRVGRGISIRKNSKNRQEIYELFKWYNNYLKKNHLADYIDKMNVVDKYVRGNNISYTHIIVDNVEELSIKQLGIVRGLLNIKPYSNFILVNNKGEGKNITPWIKCYKNSKSVKDFDEHKYKIINCGNKSVAKKISPQINNNKFIDYFTYVDFKYGLTHDFAIDNSSSNEVILNPRHNGQTLNEVELRNIPIYSSIAAGEPISINDEIEDYLNIPNYWIKGVKDPFILTVKGDSMINAGIDDGDYVVIRKQTVANHNDIVAVNLNGEATLKRLWLKKNKAVLIPENPKYDPIEIKEEGVSILGLAVGLVKRSES